MEYDIEYREDWSRNDIRKCLIEYLLTDDTYEFYRDEYYPGFKSALYHFINENLSLETYEIDFKKGNAKRFAKIEITDKLDLVMQIDIWSLNSKDYTFSLEFNKFNENESLISVNSRKHLNKLNLDQYTQGQLNLFLNKLDKYLKDNNTDMCKY